MSIFGFLKRPNVKKLAAKRDVPELIKLLGYVKDPNIQSEAALALGDIKDPIGTVSLLVALDIIENDLVHYSVVEALNKIANDDAICGLRSYLPKEKNDKIRKRIIQILGNAKDEDSIELIINQLKHNSLIVREAASEALVTIGSPKVIKHLESIRSASNKNLRVVIIDIISRIKVKGFADSHPDSSSTLWLEDISDLGNKWDNLPTDGCGFDFLASSTVLEWMARCKAIKVDDQPDYRFQRYRDFSRIIDAQTVAQQLVFYENVYLCIGSFYKSHIDLGYLEKYGFFKEYPRPPEVRFLDTYNLIRPIALIGIKKLFKKVFQEPYEEIWSDIEAKAIFKDYDGLIDWMYGEYAKDACGLASKELMLTAMIKPQYVGEILDFMEYVVQAQGFLASGNIPMYSSVIKDHTQAKSKITSLPKPSVRENTLALYQIASKNVLGHYLALDTFDNVLRLREDKRVTKIRKLLSQYLTALSESDEQIINEISNEIINARKALHSLDFTEHPTYSFIVKPLSYVPGVGTVVSIANDAIDLYKKYNERKHGWIYFGLD